MPGIQSTKVKWKTEPLRADLEKLAASISTKRAIENCGEEVLAGIFCGYLIEEGAYETTG